jgi:F-box-like
MAQPAESPLDPRITSLSRSMASDCTCSDVPENLANPPSLDNLPEHVIVSILQNVDHDDLFHCLQVSKTWATAATDDAVWRAHCHKRWAVDATAPVPPSWRDEYKCRYTIGCYDCFAQVRRSTSLNADLVVRYDFLPPLQTTNHGTNTKGTQRQHMPYTPCIHPILTQEELCMFAGCVSSVCGGTIASTAASSRDSAS